MLSLPLPKISGQLRAEDSIITEAYLDPEIVIPDSPDESIHSIENLSDIVPIDPLESSSSTLPEKDSIPTLISNCSILLQDAIDIKNLLVPHTRKRNLIALSGHAKIQRLREVISVLVVILEGISNVARLISSAAEDNTEWDDSKIQQALRFIQDIQSDLDILSSEVKSRIKTPHLAAAIEAFNTAYSAGVKDLIGKSKPSGTALIDRMNELSIGDFTVPPLPGVKKSRTDLCPLESIMTRSIRFQEQQYDLDQFIGWGMHEGSESRANAITGPMKSAHLFRSKAAPLHHEFALICFGSPGLSDSWLRVERAARRKVTRVLVQSDSFGPLFGGANLRETLTFGTRMEDLCEDADELASVYALPPTDISPGFNVAGHLHISEIAAQFSETTSADPLYQLFSANCRWFARRTVLSVAQRLQSLGVVGTIRWKARDVTSEVLATKLLNDWFGGRQMAGTRGLEIRASNLLNITRTLLLDHLYIEAISRAREALSLLESIQAPSKAQWDLVYTASWYLGSALMHRDLFVDALSSLERGRNIARQVLGDRSTRLMDESYAECLVKLDRDEEAVEVRAGIIRSIRDEIDAAEKEHPFTLEILSNTLIPHAKALLELGRPKEAFPFIIEGCEIRKKLAIYRPDLHTRSYAPALSTLSSVYAALEQNVEARVVAQLALEVSRDLFASSPDASRQSLALRLITYSKACRALKKFDDAAEALEESVGYWKDLHEKDPELFLSDYAFSLTMWQAALIDARREEEARGLIPQIVELETLVHSQDPMRYGERFADALYLSSLLLMTNVDEAAIKLGRLALDASRRLAPLSEHNEVLLLTRLFALGRIGVVAQYNDKLWVNEAAEFSREAINEAVSLWDKLVSQGLDPKLMQLDSDDSLASGLILLSRSERILEQPLPALSASSRAFEILLPQYVADPSISPKALINAREECSYSLDLLHQVSLPEALPLAQQHLAALTELTNAHPAVFKEEELAEQLYEHAVWGVSTLKRAEELKYFDMSVSIGRRLCNQWIPVVYEPYHRVLAKALFSYGGCLMVDGLVQDASRGVEILRESFDVAKDLLSQDRAKHANFMTHIVDGYADALVQTEQKEEAADIYITAVDCQRLLAEEHADSNAKDAAAELTKTLYTYLGYLFKVNRLDEAEIAGSEALVRARDLFALENTRYRKILAAALNNLATVLATQGRIEEAIEYAIEALDHYLVLKKTSSDEQFSSFQEVFGVLINKIAHFVDDDPTTLLARKGALSLAYALYELEPSKFARRLTDRLYRYAIMLGEVGQLHDAIEYGRKAEAHCRTLFEQDEDVYRADLAKILDNLATDYLNDHQHTIALPMIEECTRHYRILYQHDPSEYVNYLSHVLYAHAGALVILEQFEDALPLSEEAVLLAHQYAFDNLTIQARRFVGEALIGQAKCYIPHVRDAERSAILSEAVDLWREIVHESPSDLHSLSTAVEMRATALWLSGRQEEGFELAQEAISHIRQLCEDVPPRYRSRLATWLLQFAAMAEEQGHHDIVLAVGDEAVEITRVLVAEGTAPAQLLMDRLFLQAKFCQNQKLGEKAADLYAEGIPYLRALINEDDEETDVDDLVRLADITQSYFVVQWNLEREGPAIASYAEHITLLQRLVRLRPQKYEENLDESLEIFNKVLDSVGREKYPEYADERFSRPEATTADNTEPSSNVQPISE
ncbi:hypothetical protein DL93DRAFT_2227875 [Clavulina sp. PMI_390]|nr:hypothetical protein DL93DRAFT_2227875 [Clavulina sp. PMI_390]